MRRIRLVVPLAVGLALAAATVTPVSARTVPPPGSMTATATAPAAAGTRATVHLITGDTVTVATASGGRQTASIVPGAGRDDIVFRTVEQDGHVTVLPSDAEPLVSAGRLDRDLFDVTALVAQRFDEAHTTALPLIVDRSERAPAPTVRKLTGLADTAETVRELDSIEARSLRVAQDDLGRFWDELAPDGARTTGSALAAVPRVWLDGRVGAVLDRSTGQIGAPAVWAAGYHGEGVRTAVLDTGVDQTHPDLAGRVTLAKDFSGSTGTGDVFGHGTHVASIVGGTGAASGGARKGVAPAADLLVGKVLGDDGYGSESQVIAGMEWAAAEGADIISMSLGSDQPTDGTDPMSQALNEISRSTGALFVVAAGNSGEAGPGTVGSPGAADEALTVGAVDDDDALAAFSSRGPRLGDGAVKPDVTAPGVGIVAARAAGTTMGVPVDEYYVAASGTSMATPHVAGAAALIAGRHPDWNGARIKDALISSARTIPGQKVTDQGGGRIDAAAAALGPVVATGSVPLGSVDVGAPARTATLEYANTSGAEITLSLEPRLADAAGKAVAAGALKLGMTSVRVPAGGTAQVPLTVDPGKAGQGKYYGYVTATPAAGKAPVHTTLSLVVHGPTHRLTVKTYDTEGRLVPGALPTIWGADGFARYTDLDRAVAEVEEGAYQVSSTFLTTAHDGQELREVVLPEVKVTKDTTVTVDARRTTRVDIRTPRPAEQRGILSYQTYRSLGGNGLLQGTMFFDNAKRLYVSPTATVKDGTFEFVSRWQLVAPLLETTATGLPGKLNSSYMPASPTFGDSGATLTAVDAGDAGKPVLDHVRGKLAVVTDEEGSGGRSLIARIAAAGARAVLVVHYNDNPWTRWQPDGERWALPTVRVGADTGAALLARIHRRATQVTFQGTVRSPYLYDVTQVSAQRVPEQVTYTVSKSNSAVVHSTYAANNGLGWASEQRFGWRPAQQTAWLQYTRYVPTGFARTEYVSAGDTTWQHLVHHTVTYDQDQQLGQGMRDNPRTYRGGTETAQTWQGAVVRPSIPRGTTTPTVRDGSLLRLRIPEFTDSQSGHWSRLTALDGGGVGASDSTPPGDTATAVLHRNGEKLMDLGGGWADAEVPAGPADYRLDLTTNRNSPDWRYSTSTSTSWSFRSGKTDSATPLALLQLDYAVPVDAHNTVATAGPYDLGVTVRSQDGLPTPRGVTARVETSYDDGRTWRAAEVRGRGDNTFRAKVDGLPKDRKEVYVTLRVTVRDAAGNSVRQTVRRAFAQHR
ncbi:S8 family serine peptidase [Streptomyces sp. NPDC050263]|uniref:S8 family serine peptidase n=1 Tax=Streptomyces sp. NPDC050263 TaxID=3155037 RepID=UPI003438EA2A